MNERLRKSLCNHKNAQYQVLNVLHPKSQTEKSNFWGVFIMRFCYTTISPSRSVRCETKNHPLKPSAMWVRYLRLYQKNSNRDTIKVFKPIVKRKEKNMAQKAHSLSHTKWHYSITLCSPLNIDEKSSIINVEVVQAKYLIVFVVIKELKLSRVT